jgi:hypothetical protein
LAGLCGKGCCRLRSLWCISLGHLSCGNDFLSRSKVMLKGGYTRKCLPKCFRCIWVVFEHLTVFTTLFIVVCDDQCHGCVVAQVCWCPVQTHEELCAGQIGDSLLLNGETSGV